MAGKMENGSVGLSAYEKAAELVEMMGVSVVAKLAAL